MASSTNSILPGFATDPLLIVVIFYSSVLSRGLLVWNRLSWNSWQSSCLSFLGTQISGMTYHMRGHMPIVDTMLLSSKSSTKTVGCIKRCCFFISFKKIIHPIVFLISGIMSITCHFAHCLGKNFKV